MVSVALYSATNASDSHLDLKHAPYNVYGVKHIDLVSLALYSGNAGVCVGQCTKFASVPYL